VRRPSQSARGTYLQPERKQIISRSEWRNWVLREIIAGAWKTAKSKIIRC
jgi:hypothetical protein